jgi:4-hydroxy-3-polyprenylbenzoate decarboxylase
LIGSDEGEMATDIAAPARRTEYDSLRDWIELVQGRLDGSEFRVVRGASSEADIGAITEMLDHTAGSPSVLFDDIPGFDRGRVLVNANGTLKRQAITLGLDPASISHEALLDFWSTTLKGLRPIPPVAIESGPILEHVARGDDVDLGTLPAPIWHPKAGGRYIGTASLNILRDPDTGWVNVGTYRNQVFDRNHLGVYISPGKHGRMIREKYFERGERCPTVVVVGSDPLLFIAACSEAPRFGMDELAWAGAVRGAPIEVVRGEVTGLPIPAHAEIAIEGFIDPVERRPEGPYGEAYGYYSERVAECPFVTVERVYYRDDPIILGCPQGKPPHEDNRFGAYLRSTLIREQLEHAGVPNVTGVWIPPEAGNRGLVVVAVKQSYPGHATQAATVASQVGGVAYLGRYTVVVDDDVDIYDMDDVWWAILTRMDPDRDVQIYRRGWAGPLDQATEPGQRGLNSRMIIDATRPWEWRERFADPVVTADQARRTRERFGWILRPGDDGPTPAAG